MQYIEGKNRTQSILFPESLDQIIDQNNEVRIIDLFVESINPANFKFIIKTSIEGRPSYVIVGLMFTALNLHRIMNIVDKNVFKKFLKKLGFLFFQKRTSINKNKAVRLIPIFQNSTITLFLHAA